MAKQFNSFEKIAIKNAAKAIVAIQTKQLKIKKIIENFEAKITEYDEEIKVFEDSVKTITGGYSPTELCRKAQREDGKQSDWVFIYPDTIVPITVENPIVEHPVIEDTSEPSTENISVEEPEIKDEFADEMPAEEMPDPMDDIFKD